MITLRAFCCRAGAAIGHGLGYIKDRLGEASTWAAVGAGAASVAALAAPWSYIGFGCAIMAAMVPNRRGSDQC